MSSEVMVVVGSVSDFDVARKACFVLDELGITNETLVISAHRTPDRLYEFAKNAEDSGVKVIIAAAGGAAHLPGMIASLTCVPVLGVPINATPLNGIDSLLSIVQMPKGVPVATFAIGESGAINAAIHAAAIISINDPKVKTSLREWRARQTNSVPLVPESSNDCTDER